MASKLDLVAGPLAPLVRAEMRKARRRRARRRSGTPNVFRQPFPRGGDLLAPMRRRAAARPRPRPTPAQRAHARNRAIYRKRVQARQAYIRRNVQRQIQRQVRLSLKRQFPLAFQKRYGSDSDLIRDAVRGLRRLGLGQLAEPKLLRSIVRSSLKLSKPTKRERHEQMKARIEALPGGEIWRSVLRSTRKTAVRAQRQQVASLKRELGPDASDIVDRWARRWQRQALREADRVARKVLRTSPPEELASFNRRLFRQRILAAHRRAEAKRPVGYKIGRAIGRFARSVAESKTSVGPPVDPVVNFAKWAAYTVRYAQTHQKKTAKEIVGIPRDTAVGLANLAKLAAKTIAGADSAGEDWRNVWRGLKRVYQPLLREIVRGPDPKRLERYYDKFGITPAIDVGLVAAGGLGAAGVAAKSAASAGRVAALKGLATLAQRTGRTGAAVRLDQAAVRAERLREVARTVGRRRPLVRVGPGPTAVRELPRRSVLSRPYIAYLDLARRVMTAYRAPARTVELLEQTARTRPLLASERLVLKSARSFMQSRLARGRQPDMIDPEVLTSANEVLSLGRLIAPRGMTPLERLFGGLSAKAGRLKTTFRSGMLNVIGATQRDFARITRRLSRPQKQVLGALAQLGVRSTNAREVAEHLARDTLPKMRVARLVTDLADEIRITGRAVRHAAYTPAERELWDLLAREANTVATNTIKKLMDPKSPVRSVLVQRVGRTVDLADERSVARAIQEILPHLEAEVARIARTQSMGRLFAGRILTRLLTSSLGSTDELAGLGRVARKIAAQARQKDALWALEQFVRAPEKFADARFDEAVGKLVELQTRVSRQDPGLPADIRQARLVRPIGIVFGGRDIGELPPPWFEPSKPARGSGKAARALKRVVREEERLSTRIQPGRLRGPEAKRLRRARQDARRTAAALEGARARQARETERLAKREARIKQAVTRVRARVEAKNARFAEAWRELGRARQQLEASRARVEMLRSQIAARERQGLKPLKRQQQALQAAERAVAAREERISRKLAEIAKLRDEIIGLEGKIAAHNRTLESFRAQRAELSDKLAKAVEAHDKALRELDAAMAAANRAMSAEVKDLFERRAKAQDEFELADQAIHNMEMDPETYNEFVGHLIEMYKLQEPLYVPHIRVGTPKSARWYTIGRGLRAQPLDPKSEMKMLWTGRYDPSADRVLEGLLRNIRRKYNWAFVSATIREIVLPWSISSDRRGNILGKSIRELERERIAREIDPNRVRYVNVGMLETRLIEEIEGRAIAGRLREAGAGAEDTVAWREMLDDVAVSREEAQRLREFLDQAAVSAENAHRLDLDEYARYGWVAVDADAYRVISDTVVPQGKLGRVMQTLLTVLPSRLILGVFNIPWMVYQVFANLLQLTPRLVTSPRFAIVSLLKSIRWWRSLTPEQRAALAPHIGLSLQEDIYLGPKLGSTRTVFSTLPRLRAALDGLERLWGVFRHGVDIRGRRFPLDPTEWSFMIDRAQNQFFRRWLFYDELRREKLAKLAESSGEVADLLDEILRGGVPDDPIELFRKPEAVAALENVGRAVDRMLGDYSSFTAFERKVLRSHIMFYGFLRFSLLFMFRTLPLYHPYMMMILNRLGQIEREELEKLFGGTPPLKALVNIYYKDGKELKVIPVARAHPILNALLEADRPWEAVFGIASPTLTIPAGLVLGRDLYSNKPFVLGGEGQRDLRYDPFSIGQVAKIALAQTLRLIAPIRYYMQATSKYPGLEASDDLPWDRKYRGYVSAQGETIKSSALFRGLEQRKGRNLLLEFLFPLMPRSALPELNMFRFQQYAEAKAKYRRIKQEQKAKDPVESLLRSLESGIPPEMMPGATEGQQLFESGLPLDMLLPRNKQEAELMAKLEVQLGQGFSKPKIDTSLKNALIGQSGFMIGDPETELYDVVDRELRQIIEQETGKRATTRKGLIREVANMPEHKALRALGKLLRALGLRDESEAPSPREKPKLRPKPRAALRRVRTASVGGRQTALATGGGATVSVAPGPVELPGGTVEPVQVPNSRYVSVARKAAQAAGIDPNIFVRMIAAESGFNPHAVSPAGAIGIAQIMPSTARGWGVNPRDPVASLYAAARAIRRYLDEFGSYELALAAYNAGPGAVKRYGGVPPYAETQRYVARILGDKSSLSIGSLSLSDPSVDSYVRLPAQEVTLADTEGYLRDLRRARAARSLVRSRRAIAKVAQVGGRKLTPDREPLALAAKFGLVSFRDPDIANYQQTYEIPSEFLGVSSSGSQALQAGGGYAGTEMIVKSVPTFGLRVSSEKRARRWTSSGNVSDHWVGARNAYARDLAGSKAQMDRAFRKLGEFFGVKLRYNAINNFTITVGGARYRVQIIYGPAVEHGDHIHIGVKRL